MNSPVIRDFKTFQQLAALLSKDYAQDFLKLLIIYKNISASEAATRLGLHIKTAQDFLEGLATVGLLEKKEAGEKKRPYFRYSLKHTTLNISLDLSTLHKPLPKSSLLNRKIKERQNSGALFKEGESNRIALLQVFIGEGRSRREKRLNLTPCQGRFLFYLPFPTEKALSVKEIMAKAKLSDDCLPEIEDLLKILEDYGIVEQKE